MRTNNDIASVWPHATSIRIPGQWFAHVESVLLVLAARTKSETAIILAYPAVDAVAEALVEVDRDLVRTADVEIDEEAAVYVVGRGLEEVHEDAGEREAPVFGCDRQGGDVTVKIMRRPFRLAQDVSHQSPAGVLGGAAHVWPAREVIEIKAEAIRFGPNV